MTTKPLAVGSRRASQRDEDLPAVLDRLATWLRRATPTLEWNSVALSTLDHLVRLGPMRVTDLVAAERITQPGMTALIGRMAAAGLVERRPDPDDGRATLVSVTRAGEAYLAGIHRARADVIATHISDLSSEHQAILASATDALAALASLPFGDREVRR